VCIDEMHKNVKGGVVETLNHIISESHVEINTKGMREKSEQIFCNILMFSNNDDAAIIRKGDRRYWPHRVNGVKDPIYYHNLWEWQQNGDNLSHMLAWCKARDLSNFSYNKPPPVTATKLDMQEESLDYLESLIVDAISSREGPFGADVTSYSMVENYIASQIDSPLNIQTRSSLKALFSRHSKKASDALIRTGAASGHRHRPRIVRNEDRWLTVDPVKVREELIRSEQMLLRKKVNPPVLSEVGNNT